MSNEERIFEERQRAAFIVRDMATGANPLLTVEDAEMISKFIIGDWVDPDLDKSITSFLKGENK